MKRLKVDKNISALLEELVKIPGGYVYSGACSYQVCFPLKQGGELRLGIYDDGPDRIQADLYDGKLPGITGPTSATGG